MQSLQCIGECIPNENLKLSPLDHEQFSNLNFKKVFSNQALCLNTHEKEQLQLQVQYSEPEPVI